MKIYLYVIFILICTNFSAFAQDQKPQYILVEDNDTTPVLYKSLGDDVSRKLTRMGVIYKEPEKFIKTSEIECFDGMGYLAEALGCLPYQFLSDDDEFIVFMPLYSFAKEDSIKRTNVKVPPINTRHIGQIAYPIKVLMGETDWKKVVRYYPQEVTKSKFHADSVIRFTIPLQTSDFYKKRYEYIDGLIIQKNGFGYVSFYCFYTKKAKKNLDKYWKIIEGMLRFEE